MAKAKKKTSGTNPKPTALQRQIEKITGADRIIRQDAGKGKGGRDVNMGKVQRGKRKGFGNRMDKRDDLVKAFGGD